MSRARSLVLASALTAASLTLHAQPTTPAQSAPRATVGATSAPFWTGMTDPATFEGAMSARLAHARETATEFAATTTRTVQNTLVPYDHIQLEIDAVESQAGLIQEVHPVEAFRKAAERVMPQVGAFKTALSLNRRIYDAIAAVDLARADEETKYYVQRTLRDFRLAGVDKDDDVRRRITQLSQELVGLSQEFSRNIRANARQVKTTSTAELDGLPEDFVARHKPDANGVRTIGTTGPDFFPVMAFARSDDLRKRLYVEFNNRAYPENLSVLDKMIAARTELARLNGFSTWADYATFDKMAGTASEASAFIDRVVSASAPKVKREFDALVARKARDLPGATAMSAWELPYYSEQVRAASHGFDSQSVRPYFAFDRVKAGVLEVTGRLFGVTYRRVMDVPVWDPSVEVYEMRDALDRSGGDTLIGRFYLDMHPRRDKFTQDAEFNIRTGVANFQVGEAALVCNLPGGAPGDPGLMTHGDVITFFHEFGHLAHVLLSGRHRWLGVGGNRTETDFVEAPSQMLEEWTWDPATLALFARHYQTNEPIPPALVERMRDANEFGKALGLRTQMIYARVSLDVYNRDPKQLDTTAIVREFSGKYRPFPFVEGTHLQAAFGQLDDYSAGYYSYMWSLVIAKDLFSRFDRNDLLAPAVARRYRETILAPGGSKPAASLVRDFLGRPFDVNAWQDWLDR